MDPAVTRLSSKGQIVIPVDIRRRLGLSPGDELQVSAEPGERAIVLRLPSSGEVESRLERGYRWLEQRGEDMVDALHKSRRAAHASEGRRR